MPRKDQSSISVPKWVWKKVKEHYEENEKSYRKRGIHSATGIVVRLILENIPPFEHFNVYEDHATVVDRKTKRMVDVYLRNKKPYCDYCEEFDCKHIQFLLNKEDFRKMLRKYGWKL